MTTTLKLDSFNVDETLKVAAEVKAQSGPNVFGSSTWFRARALLLADAVEALAAKVESLYAHIEANHPNGKLVERVNTLVDDNARLTAALGELLEAGGAYESLADRDDNDPELIAAGVRLLAAQLAASEEVPNV